MDFVRQTLHFSRFKAYRFYFNIISKRYTVAKENPFSVKIKRYQIMYDKDLLYKNVQVILQALTTFCVKRQAWFYNK